MYSELVLVIGKDDLQKLEITLLDEVSFREPVLFCYKGNVMFQTEDWWNKYINDRSGVNMDRFVPLYLRSANDSFGGYKEYLQKTEFIVNAKLESNENHDKLIGLLEDLFTKLDCFMIIKIHNEEGIHTRKSVDEFDEFLEIWFNSFLWGDEKGLIIKKGKF